MRIIDEIYNKLHIPDELLNYYNPTDVLFFDIETTGLNKATTSCYLIGCGYYKNDILNTKFYFADTPQDEYDVLSSFFEFVKNFKVIIHFNGTKFDLPYLEYRAKLYDMPNPLNELESFDLYKEIKPLRSLLFRESMRQKCVEEFLEITRKDTFNGGELIPIYEEYANTGEKELFELLMMHNREDVLGMHKMFPILNYLKLDQATLSYKEHVLSSYTDMYDNEKKEVIITYAIDKYIPKSFSVKNSNIYFKFEADKQQLLIRIPVTSGNLRHYYENYNDYYILTAENTCVHKSIAMSVDKSYKKKATKDTCYSIVDGDFLPQPEIICQNTAGLDYKTRNSFFKITHNLDEELLTRYGTTLLKVMVKSKPKKNKTQA